MAVDSAAVKSPINKMKDPIPLQTLQSSSNSSITNNKVAVEVEKEPKSEFMKMMDRKR